MTFSPWLTALEVCGLAALVAGIAMWSIPLALVVAGALVIVACELADRRRVMRTTVRLQARGAGVPPGERL